VWRLEMVTRLGCLSQSSTIVTTPTPILLVLVFATSFGIQKRVPHVCAECAQPPILHKAKIIRAFVPIQ
jgi:hypothetical protein